MNKKLISIIICLILIMSCVTNVYAGIERESVTECSKAAQKIIKDFKGNVSSHTQALILADMEKLEIMGLLNDYKSISFAKENEDAVKCRSYIIDFDGISNIIEVLANTEEVFSVRITEDEKVNIYTETKDGKVYIDGYEVKMCTREEICNVKANDLIMPLATETWFQTSCPYGSASDYTYKQTSLCYNENEVKFNVALQKLTFSAFKGSLVKSVVGSLGITGAKRFASETVLKQLVKYNPESKAVSYSIDLYTHKNYTSGFISPIITRVWKYNYKYYATANLTGSYATEYEFKCQM